MRPIVLSIAAFGSVLLASGCAHKPAASASAMLCPDAPSSTRVALVKIEIDTVALKANPKECYVHSDTEVIWVSDKDSFEAKFKVKSPAKDGKMNYKSKPVGVKNEADFKAKQVAARERFDYDANSKGREIDPSVIIDP